MGLLRGALGPEAWPHVLCNENEVNKMAVYSIVGAIALIVVIFFVSVLTPLAWYQYLPFIALFILAYFWEKIIKIFRGSNAGKGRSVRKGKARKRTSLHQGKRI
ncbi:hypothetical protein [Desulfuromonas acetoxidans]|uniref:hypothetical protein n=1 Tax=Desulfuromonas acetoxidans TaxID=891 RepID=UPI00058D5109|nr:hypothetical protein [Desulfuromonas acetoxidans]MBF0644320.1 hypothetical protein [Desulfuromonas acetoxidans]NVD23516.1 hypothetical protein [Desulfuromonas acetoxidans]NVE16099.1 hypothetical protein [Desulfuromonas acetoxidans]